MIIRNKQTSGHIRSVNFDTYGNAIPNVPSVFTAGSSIAASIVETRDVIIKPSKKRKNKTLLLANPSSDSLIKRLMPWSAKKAKSTSVTVTQNHANGEVVPYIPTQEIKPHSANISEFIELSFKRLNNEFDSREKQLELRFHALEQRNKLTIEKKRHWIIPVAILAAIAGGYMLYVLTSMQHSMTLMSSSIPQMNQHMGVMATDTHKMANGMQSMNQKMGSISESIEPIGEAASTAQPFMGMMRSFMPF